MLDKIIKLKTLDGDMVKVNAGGPVKAVLALEAGILILHTVLFKT